MESLEITIIPMTVGEGVLLFVPSRPSAKTQIPCKLELSVYFKFSFASTLSLVSSSQSGSSFLLAIDANALFSVYAYLFCFFMVVQGQGSRGLHEKRNKINVVTTRGQGCKSVLKPGRGPCRLSALLLIQTWGQWRKRTKGGYLHFIWNETLVTCW